jgi:hypothetical protein
MKYIIKVTPLSPKMHFIYYDLSAEVDIANLEKGKPFPAKFIFFSVAALQTCKKYSKVNLSYNSLKFDLINL